MNKAVLKRSEGDQLTVRATRVHIAAQEAEKLLLPALMRSVMDAISEEKRPYALKHRVKTAAAICEKVRRKRQESQENSDEKWRYEPEHLTDASGFRIVTRFLQHIPEVVGTLLDLIRHETAISSPFKKNGLKELVIYTSRPDGDPLSINDMVKRVVENAGFTAALAKPETKKSGYSSVHIVAYVPVSFTGPDGKTESRDFPVEIQLRDIFEEAWSETEHALRYVPQRGGVIDGNDPLLSTWMPYLNALKTTLDGASQQASVIFNNAILARQIAEGGQHPDSRPADTVGTTRAMLFDLLPANLHELVTNAFVFREKGEKAGPGADANEFYQKAAEGFGEVYRNATEAKLVKPSKDSCRDLEYLLRMEEAFCRSLASDDDREAIIGIYENLMERFPQDTLVLYRLGCILRNSDAESSKTYLERALASLGRGCVAKTHWLNSAVPRNLAFTLWQLSRKAKSYDAASDLLQEAIKLTAQALVNGENISDGAIRDREKLKARNNSSYYLLEVARKAQEAGRETAEKKEALLEALRALETTGDLVIGDMSSVETLAASYNWIGDREKARRYASTLAKLLYNVARLRIQHAGGHMPVSNTEAIDVTLIAEMRKYLKGLETMCYDTAVSILFGSAVEGT